MSDARRENHPSLGAIIEALYHSDISGAVSWFPDGVWSVVLGDPLSQDAIGSDFSDQQKAAEWLREKAVSRHPDSDFAKRFSYQ